MHEQFRQYLAQRTTISEKELDYILTHFELKHTTKNEILLSANKTCKHLYFIQKGCLRIFCIQDDGQEWTRFVAFENEFATSMPSFINQEPSMAYIQTIEPSELLAVTYNDFYKLIDRFPEWERFYRVLLEHAYVKSVKRIEEFITMDAWQMYNTTLRNCPKLSQRLSNKQYASYLGISQETLSRLKSRR